VDKSTDLPTPNCTQGLHDYFGGACYFCCEYCNYDRHVCYSCGDDLRHDGTLFSTREPNPCYVEHQDE
jgi:hypothetical protein